MSEEKPKTILYYERKKRGWTQAQVAQKLNTSEEDSSMRGAATADMVRKWEHGFHTPSPFYVDRLCRLFDCTADQLGLVDVVEDQKVMRVPSPAFLDAPSQAMWLMRLITMIDRWPPSRCRNLQAALAQELNMNQGNNQAISRREAILAIAALPVALFHESQSAPPVEDLLTRYAASIPACWHLYFDGCSQEIKAYLPLHLPQLAVLAKTPSKYQKIAASLASQAYQLDWLLALNEQDFGHALLTIKEAEVYGKLSDDPNIIRASLTRRAHIFFHLKNPVQQWRYHEEALQYVPESTPLGKSYIYMAVAENHAALNRTKEADRFLGLARDSFPERPEEDPISSYAPFNQYTLSFYECLTYLKMKQPAKALQSLDRVEKDIPTGLVPRRVELTTHKLMAFCDLGDLDAVHSLFEDVEKAARQTSKLRHNEVCEVYAQMCRRWPDERRVLELQDLLL